MLQIINIYFRNDNILLSENGKLIRTLENKISGLRCTNFHVQQNLVKQALKWNSVEVNSQMSCGLILISVSLGNFIINLVVEAIKFECIKSRILFFDYLMLF